MAQIVVVVVVVVATFQQQKDNHDSNQKLSKTSIACSFFRCTTIDRCRWCFGPFQSRIGHVIIVVVVVVVVVVDRDGTITKSSIRCGTISHLIFRCYRGHTKAQGKGQAQSYNQNVDNSKSLC